MFRRTWQHANGAVMPIAKLAVDTGYEAAAVYAWARAQGFEQVAPVKGVEGFNRSSPVSGPTYVDATEAPWAPHFRMWDYVTRDLAETVFAHFPLRRDAQGMTGHSMGGHGALTLALLDRSARVNAISAALPALPQM